eukprot:TRINITY_DN9115_c0_g1_i1.p1 TRINITY_DN9115_c0_g1~~TRINITY_DN9115_c0_g1_i1.p1  ORF type:complete len:329 (-),score=-1.12 TRINITY_DN9115_c0_g1_i1:202-1131(-)
MDSIPVFHLAQLLEFDEKESERFRRCIEVWGGFRITNHGVSAVVIDAAEKAGKAAFKVPYENKKKYGESHLRAYIGHATEMPTHETFSIPLSTGVSYFCDTIWAGGDNCEYREALENYAQEMKQLSQKLDQVILGNLGVSKYYESMFKNCDFRLRLNYYHDVGDNTPKFTCLSEHTDIGIFTIVKEDLSVGGLQIFRESVGKWLDVEPQPQSFMVFLGDMLKAWTNGRTHNLKHRVTTMAGAGDRLTFAFFNHFPSDALIYAPEELVDLCHPRKYRAFRYQDFVTAKYGEQFQQSGIVIDTYAALSNAE